jgi:hypothetical protein
MPRRLVKLTSGCVWGLSWDHWVSDLMNVLIYPWIQIRIDHWNCGNGACLEEVGLWWGAFTGHILALVPALSSYASWPTMKCATLSVPFHRDVLPRNKGACWPWTETFEIVSQNKSFLPYIVPLSCLSQQWRTNILVLSKLHNLFVYGFWIKLCI